jgi:hypothetical protein
MASREDVMIGWFANAIMTGCDHQAWKTDAERKPVPVSERLPGLEDCDALGRCWWFCPASFLENGMCAYWCLAPGYQVPPKTYWTHWLPHHALPVPSSQESTDA